MKFAILSLAAAGALTFSAGSALAGPPGHNHGAHNHGGYHHGGYNHYSGYRGGYSGGYRGYYSPSYVYPASGFSLGVGSFGLSIGNSYAYPYSYGGYYSRPYYGGYGRRW